MTHRSGTQPDLSLRHVQDLEDARLRLRLTRGVGRRREAWLLAAHRLAEAFYATLGIVTGLLAPNGSIYILGALGVLVLYRAFRVKKAYRAYMKSARWHRIKWLNRQDEEDAG